MPRPASRPPSCRTASARRSSTTTCCRTCARPISTAPWHVALAEDRRGRHAGTRRVARSARARSMRSSAWSAPRSSSSDCPAGPSSTGAGSARTRSTSTIPSVLMPAPPPDLTARLGRDGHGRPHVPTRPDDGDARPRQPRPDRVPRGEAGLSRQSQGRHRRRPAARATPRSRPSGRSTRVGRSVRPRTLALHELQTRSATAADGYIEPDDLPKFGDDVDDFDEALERTSSPQAGSREKPSKVVTRWAGRGVLAIVGGVIALVVGLNVPISGPDPDRRRGDRRRDRRLAHRPRHAGGHDARGDDPGDARRLPADAPEDHGPGALDAAGRRRGRSATGSTRPTRPSSGAPRSASRATSRAS